MEKLRGASNSESAGNYVLNGVNGYLINQGMPLTNYLDMFKLSTEVHFDQSIHV